ncbi:YqeB family protein [Aureibacillus halotolerans]|uniref:DUF308 domain-containing protein n=1 Tax=Aureibacillus halotolerans TaxID=1508390 RepID=A0A4R6UD06_9BACI|nr:DUF308 domain-containing protein [Aureibacillus halotolerans]TDQ42645.1 hypothetical protein EV213_10174 [Aureibacillus halotolerans]
MTHVGLSKAGKVAFFIGPLVLCGILGWFLPVLLYWAMTIEWLPLPGWLEKLSLLKGFWVPFATTALGLIAGAWLADVIKKETLDVVLTDCKVEATLNREKTIFIKKDIQYVFLNHSNLVIVGFTGREWLHAEHASTKKRVRDAFISHGYPWIDTDPFQNDYRLWVPDTTELPPSANAILTERAKAMKKDKTKDVKLLKREVEKLGVTVQNKEKHQYWRLHKEV